MADYELQVFCLEAGKNYESQIYRISAGNTVRFTLGASLYGRSVFLYTNSPLEGNSFDRRTYRKLDWKFTYAEYADEGSSYTDCTFYRAGSFRFYFTLDNEKKENGCGFLLVDPILMLAGKELPLDGVQCQTVLSKCLGPFDEWQDKVVVAKETGYNFIHFTPIQALGVSNSAYSLKNHQALNESFTSEKMTPTFDDVHTFVKDLDTKHNVLSLTDIVLNHTANETPWLREHPECSFNANNSPHLRPAMLLDQAMYLLSMQAMRGELQDRGIPPEISTENHLNAVKSGVKDLIFPKLKLHEFYMVNVDKLVAEFEAAPSVPVNQGRHILQPIHSYKRLGARVDISKAKQVFQNSYDFKSFLYELNARLDRETWDHLDHGVENIIKGMRYFKIDPYGPNKHELTKDDTLVVRYFLPNHDTVPDEISVEEMEECFGDERGNYIMAHNGWVMGDDPLRNFALEGSMVYLRRELIAWGDSCKLRYGDSPKDCPFLWKYMEDYVMQSAQMFHGLRLDNCHSTPINVAEHLLDKAREVRGDLYVIAELFTSSEGVDNIFVNRLGINSLIREALQAGDSHELGRLVHRFGGIPVGSFFHAKGIKPLMPSVAHAIFVDMTHDNPSPFEKRSVYDYLPSAALVSMASCATGSNRGYDELVPHHIHVVEEKRTYSAFTQIGMDAGIIAAKRQLNDMHYKLAMEGYEEVYVDQIDYNTVSVTRRCPQTDSSVVLVSRTAFQHPDNPDDKGDLKHLNIPGVVERIMFEARTIRDISVTTPFCKDSIHINGMNQFMLEMKSDIVPSESNMVNVVQKDEENTEIQFKHFAPGSVIAFRVSVGPSSRANMELAREILKPFGYFNHQVQVGEEVTAILRALDLSDVNRILFRCDTEEGSDRLGFGAYSISVLGAMLYCGLQGVMTHLAYIRPRNDLGHPLCDNIRQGDWLIDYLVKRLMPHKDCVQFAILLESMLKPVRGIPHYLKPCYFDAVITALYTQLLDLTWMKMSKFISCGSNFVKQLSLASVILTGFVYDSPLPQLSSDLQPPAKTSLDALSGKMSQHCPTLAAGLPHFSTGYMRNWGRDTFIALRGLLLLTGRFQEARAIILGFGGTLRHGLIPNLLDRGTNSRYNCRDAVWFWLECIKQYCISVPNGEDILKDTVSRMYPQDDSEPNDVDVNDQPLQVVMQEAVQKHWNGISFRERNAGTKIDSQMKDLGFNVALGVNHSTGLVFGGNEHNCGTWMDKMGCIPGRNQGVPASPRDGSAVELVGLCKSVVTWLADISQAGNYPYTGVETLVEGETTTVGYKDWAARIQSNFEKHFWVPLEGVGPHDSRPDLINRRGIYKDTVGSKQPWADYQFRPNFTIAMVVAPELFNKDHAKIALNKAKELLKGPLGMKTLDPGDMTYNGNYDNSDPDGGFNYHRGPEWLWPIGYYLRAQLLFNDGIDKAKVDVRQALKPHFEHLQSSPWKGLPELTNENGATCHHSCPIQAWSHSCLLEVLYHLYHT